MSDKTALGGVTEQMITEDEQNQALSPANVRHTLRTPLNHIIGYSEMLLEEADERGLVAFTADLQKIHKAGKQLLGFINEFFRCADDDRQVPSTYSKSRPPPTVSFVSQRLTFILCRELTERRRVASSLSTIMKATETCFPAVCNTKVTTSASPTVAIKPWHGSTRKRSISYCLM